MPLRARCIWDIFREPLALAWSASRFSIQLSRSGISPPGSTGMRWEFWNGASPQPAKEKYGIGWEKRQLVGTSDSVTYVWCLAFRNGTVVIGRKGCPAVFLYVANKELTDARFGCPESKGLSRFGGPLAKKSSED